MDEFDIIFIIVCRLIEIVIFIFVRPIV